MTLEALKARDVFEKWWQQQHPIADHHHLRRPHGPQATAAYTDAFIQIQWLAFNAGVYAAQRELVAGVKALRTAAARHEYDLIKIGEVRAYDAVLDLIGEPSK